MKQTELVPVLLCGGTGTRLWPLSRESYPKQFLALEGNGRSMLQNTMARLVGLEAMIPVSDSPIAVCNHEHRFLAAQQMSEMGIRVPRVVLEPVARNTAPALTLAALVATREAEASDPVLLVMPADHVVRDVSAFHVAVRHAYSAAVDGAMLTFGVVPLRAETGYGYIKVGKRVDEVVHEVAGFIEKPTLATAEQLIATGDHVWNSGIFAVRASVWLQAINDYRPDIAQTCQAALDAGDFNGDFVRPDKDAFSQCPSDSIDYAVMERLPQDQNARTKALVVPFNAEWSDVGSWDALWNVLPHDPDGNACLGDTVDVECRNTLLISNGRLIAAVGLEGLVVIETPDAILVADQQRAQIVKNVVTTLRNSGKAMADTHRKTHRPWGWYDSIDSGERFQVKRIVVNPGASLSTQMHYHRAEHWVVVRGTAEVLKGDSVQLLHENESTYIQSGQVHRLRNPGRIPLEIIEIQSGGYLKEDDIVRYEDAYGRV
jgi:mannose-1-phosphate guanylyltransferase/mannose-6-phosphate isomerase